MGDWTSFQEDFWKVLSTLGINHDNDVDPKATVPKPENDAKEQKNPDVTSRHGHEAESAQRGVWDSRIPHPVPSYPRLLDDGLVAALCHNIDGNDEDIEHREQLDAWRHKRKQAKKVREQIDEQKASIARAEAELSHLVGPGFTVVRRRLDHLKIDDSDKTDVPGPGPDPDGARKIPLDAQRSSVADSRKKLQEQADRFKAELEQEAGPDARRLFERRAMNLELLARRLQREHKEKRRGVQHQQQYEVYQAYQQQASVLTKTKAGITRDGPSTATAVVAVAVADADCESSAAQRAQLAVSRARAAVARARVATDIVAAYEPGGIAARIFAGPGKGKD